MKALDKMLKFHKSSCTHFVYSGDRHCSCGRDEAAAELAAMQNVLEMYANSDNWKSINGVMVFQTMGTPWSYAQAALKGGQDGEN